MFSGVNHMAKQFSNIIDGKQSSGSATFESRNPADWSEVIGEFPSSGQSDVEAAVSAARTAFPSWSRTPAPRRAEVLFRAAERLAREKEDFSRLMTREMGKVLTEASGDVQEGVDMLYYIAGEGRRLF